MARVSIEKIYSRLCEAASLPDLDPRDRSRVFGIMKCLRDEKWEEGRVSERVMQKARVGPYFYHATIKMLTNKGFLIPKKEGRRKRFVFSEEGRKAQMKLDEVLSAPKAVLGLGLDLGEKESRAEITIEAKGMSEVERLEALTKPHIVYRFMELAAGLSEFARHHPDLSISIKLEPHVEGVIPRFAAMLWAFYLKVVKGPITWVPSPTDALDVDMHMTRFWELRRYDVYWEKRLEAATEWLEVRKELEDLFKRISKLEEAGKEPPREELESRWERVRRKHGRVISKLREVEPISPPLPELPSLEVLERAKGEPDLASYLPEPFDILGLTEDMIDLLENAEVRRWVDRRLDEAHASGQDFFMPMLFWSLLKFKPRRTDLEKFRYVSPPTFTSVTYPKHVEVLRKLLSVFESILEYKRELYAERKFELSPEDKRLLETLKAAFSRLATRNWPGDEEMDEERKMYAFLWDQLGSLQDDPALYEGWRLLKESYEERLEEISGILNAALERYVFADHRPDVDLAAVFIDLIHDKNPDEAEGMIKSGLYRLKENRQTRTEKSKINILKTLRDGKRGDPRDWLYVRDAEKEMLVRRRRGGWTITEKGLKYLREREKR